jgi:hypothetical protein
MLEMARSGFSNIADYYKKLRDANYSKWRIVWIKAIRQVIIQRQVARNTILWEAYEAKVESIMKEKTQGRIRSLTSTEGLEILVVDDSALVRKRTQR